MTDVHTLDVPALSLDVLSHGHILHALRATTDDNTTTDCLLGFANPADHHHSAARTFFNCVVGRYANRLPSGELRLDSGAKLTLPGAQGVCLHGGESGFDTLPWAPIARTDSALFPATDADHPEAPPASDPTAPVSESSSLHRIYSPAGADGFPCSLVVEALCVVLAPKEGETDVAGRKGRSLGKVKVVLRAKIREDGDEGISKGTPVNLTMHWGFRLDDCKDKDVLGHSLYLASDKLVALDDLGLATGKIDKIEEGGEMDFYTAGIEGPHVKIGERYPKEGIDRNFLFNTPPPSLVEPSSSARLSTEPQVILTGPVPPSGSNTPQLSLRFTSNQPSAQVYTAPSLDGTGPARKPAHGGPALEKDKEDAAPTQSQDSPAEQAARKEGYGAHAGVFIEFQAPVGAVQHCAGAGREKGNELEKWMEERARERKAEEEGRGWERDTVLHKGQIYENWVEVEVVAL
ncbi:hypothetical protein JCM10207_004685 [Rhodosporidiobolus poonsookiae]